MAPPNGGALAVACWVVQRASVKLKGENWDHLVAALKDPKSGFRNVRVSADGQSLTAYGENGSVSIDRRTMSVDAERSVAGDLSSAVDRAYSRETVRRSAARFGWTLKETKPGEFQAIKRA